MRGARSQFVPVDNQPRPFADAPLLAGLLEPGDRALAYPDTLLLSDRGQNAQYRVFEDPTTIEILLSQASEAYAGGLEAPEVVQRLQHALAREASRDQNSTRSNLHVEASAKSFWN